VVQLFLFYCAPDFTSEMSRVDPGCARKELIIRFFPIQENKFAANDRLGLEFRTEFFNIFNRTQLPRPTRFAAPQQ